MNDAEFQRRLAEADDDAAKLDALVLWLIEQGLPEGTARLMVTVEAAALRGDMLDGDAFP